MIRPLLKLGQPKPADWGWDVSVCIAALCDHRKKIICVTDNRASFLEFSAERAVLKNWPIASSWAALYAGNDVEHADPIIRSAHERAMNLVAKVSRRANAEEITQILDDAYAEQLQAHIENRILRKHGFDADSFKALGKNRCTSEVYARTWDRIDKEELSLQFLAAGFGEEEQGHIWLVKGDSAPVCYNSLGFWAIGTGASAALSSLAFHVSRQEFSVYSTLAEAIYFCLAAKFMAEPASDVGPSTFVVIIPSDEKEQLMFMSEPGIETVRKIWNKHGTPRVPKKSIEGVISKLTFVSAEDTSIESLEARLGKPGFFQKKLAKEAKQSTSEKSKQGP